MKFKTPIGDYIEGKEVGNRIETCFMMGCSEGFLSASLGDGSETDREKALSWLRFNLFVIGIDPSETYSQTKGKNYVFTNIYERRDIQQAQASEKAKEGENAKSDQ